MEDERRVQRLRLRDIMSICQNRYLLPDLAGNYLKLFDLAKTLYDSVSLTDFKYNKRFDEIITRLGELEEQARPFLAAAAAEPPAQPKKQRGGFRPGAGRPGKGYERRKPTLSLPPEYWKQFDDLAALIESDQAGLIRSIMMTVLDGIAANTHTIVCPVCAGGGSIQPKALPEAIVCPGCNGEGELKQILMNL